MRNSRLWASLPEQLARRALAGVLSDRGRRPRARAVWSTTAGTCAALVLAGASLAETRNLQPDVPKPEALVSLIRAARANYRSFDAELEKKGYEYVDGRLPAQPDLLTKIIWRWTPSRSVSHEIQVQRSPAGTEKRSENVYAISPKWCMRLYPPTGGRRRAIVQRSGAMRGGADIRDALWAEGAYHWSRITNTNSQISREEGTGYLVLSARTSDEGSRVVTTIDPARGYLPVRSENIRPDGTTHSRREFSDWRAVTGGLWLPFQWVWELPGEYRFVTTVKRDD